MQAPAPATRARRRRCGSWRIWPWRRARRRCRSSSTTPDRESTDSMLSARSSWPGFRYLHDDDVCAAIGFAAGGRSVRGGRLLVRDAFGLDLVARDLSAFDEVAFDSLCPLLRELLVDRRAARRVGAPDDDDIDAGPV